MGSGVLLWLDRTGSVCGERSISILSPSRIASAQIYAPTPWRAGNSKSRSDDLSRRTLKVYRKGRREFLFVAIGPSAQFLEGIARASQATEPPQMTNQDHLSPTLVFA